MLACKGKQKLESYGLLQWFQKFADMWSSSYKIGFTHLKDICGKAKQAACGWLSANKDSLPDPPRDCLLDMAGNN